MVIWDLEGLAAVAQTLGQPTRAVKLLSASQAVRLACGVPVAVSDHTNYMRTLASARRALLEEAFTQAWLAGQAMLLDEAVTYALTGESV